MDPFEDQLFPEHKHTDPKKWIQFVHAKGS